MHLMSPVAYLYLNALAPDQAKCNGAYERLEPVVPYKGAVDP